MAAASASSRPPRLTAQALNPHLLKAEYAVRGLIPQRAAEIVGVSPSLFSFSPSPLSPLVSLSLAVWLRLRPLYALLMIGQCVRAAFPLRCSCAAAADPLRCRLCFQVSLPLRSLAPPSPFSPFPDRCLGIMAAVSRYCLCSCRWVGALGVDTKGREPGPHVHAAADPFFPVRCTPFPLPFRLCSPLSLWDHVGSRTAAARLAGLSLDPALRQNSLRLSAFLFYLQGASLSLHHFLLVVPLAVVADAQGHSPPRPLSLLPPQELADGSTQYPFREVVFANIGNPQALNQQPITFNRQVSVARVPPSLALFAPPPAHPHAPFSSVTGALPDGERVAVGRHLQLSARGVALPCRRHPARPRLPQRGRRHWRLQREPGRAHCARRGGPVHYR